MLIFQNKYNELRDVKMKKMQCEVCGSNEIRKVSDDIFECKYCGVQYSKDEVQKLLVEITGNVKIDHSNDAENAIKRAKQFESEGDNKKAKEYYEKALDYDPDNQIARDALSHTVSDNFYILEKNISSSDMIRNSFDYLYQCKNVIPNVFSNLKDVTITEKYYPFTIMFAELSGQFSGTACYKHEVPYTDYETKTDYNNKNQDGTYKKIQVAVTKYRTEIERKPANGFFSTSAYEVRSISSELGLKIAKCESNNVDKSENIYTDLYKKLEAKVCKLIKEEKDFKKLDISKTEQENGVSEFKDTKIDVNFKDTSWISRAGSIFADKKSYACESSARLNCPGDYSENVTYSVTSQTVSHKTVYIPILIIEYKYKDKAYTILSILNDKYSEISAVYPADKEAKENISNKVIANQKVKEATGAGGAAALTGIVGVILWIIGAFADSLGIMLFGIGMLLLITLPCGLVESKRTKEKRKQLAAINQKSVEQKRKVSGVLEASYNNFIDVYEKTNNIEEATEHSKSMMGVTENDLPFDDSISDFSKIIPFDKEKSRKSVLNSSSQNVGKVFITIGPKGTIAPCVRIYVNGIEKGIIKSEETIRLDIEKDSVIDMKWNQAFTKISTKAYYDQVKLINLSYGGMNLIMEEFDEDNRFDSLLQSGDMDAAIEKYCQEYDVNESDAKEALEKRKITILKG